MEGCSPQIQPKKIKGDESKKKIFFVQKTNLSVKDFLLFADLCKKKKFANSFSSFFLFQSYEFQKSILMYKNLN